MVFNHDLELAILQLAAAMDSGDASPERFYFLTPENLDKHFVLDETPTPGDVVAHAKILGEAGLIDFQFPLEEEPDYGRVGGITYAGRLRLYDLLRDKMLGVAVNDIHRKLERLTEHLGLK